jgi:hypothetical protein
VKAFDDNGKEVFPIIMTMLCPVEYINKAREYTASHQQNVEKAIDDTVEKMLPEAYSSNGMLPATHYGCSRLVYTHTIKKALKTLKELSKDNKWCCDKEMTIDDNPDFIKSNFCCITGKWSDLLAKLGLQRIL